MNKHAPSATNTCVRKPARRTGATAVFFVLDRNIPMYGENSRCAPITEINKRKCQSCLENSLGIWERPNTYPRPAPPRRRTANKTYPWFPSTPWTSGSRRTRCLCTRRTFLAGRGSASPRRTRRPGYGKKIKRWPTRRGGERTPSHGNANTDRTCKGTETWTVCSRCDEWFRQKGGRTDEWTCARVV